MLTRSETRKLRDDMRAELEGRANTLWICAAGLCFVLALSLIGAGWRSVPEAPAYAASGSSR